MTRQSGQHLKAPDDVVFLLDCDNTLLDNDLLDFDVSALLAPARAAPAGDDMQSP